MRRNVRPVQLHEQPVEALHELGGVAELAAFRKLRLLVKQQRQLLEAHRIGEAVEVLYQRVADIELEHRLRLRNRLARGRENPPHAGAEIMLAEHQAGG